MRKMKRQPTHPGVIIKADYLEPLHLTVTDMANKLGVSRKTLLLIWLFVLQEHSTHHLICG